MIKERRTWGLVALFLLFIGSILALSGCSATNAAQIEHDYAKAIVQVNLAITEVESESTPDIPESSGSLFSSPPPELLAQIGDAIEDNLHPWVIEGQHHQILLFTAPWCTVCKPCYIDTPGHPSIQTRLEEKNWVVTVLELDSADEDKAAIAAAAKEYYGGFENIPMWVILEDGEMEASIQTTNWSKLCEVLWKVVEEDNEPQTEQVTVSGLGIGTLNGGQFLLDHAGQTVDLNETTKLVVPSDVSWTEETRNGVTTLTFTSTPRVETKLRFLVLRTTLSYVTFSTTQVTLGLDNAPDVSLAIDWAS